MPRQEITPEQHRKIHELHSQGLNKSDIGRQLNLYRATVAKFLLSPPPAETPKAELKSSSEVKGDEWKIDIPKGRHYTLDELVEKFKVDTDVWQVREFRCNVWEMGFIEHVSKGPRDAQGRQQIDKTAGSKELYQTRAVFQRHKDADFAKRAIERLVEKAKRYAPKKFPEVQIPRPKSGNAVEYSIVDFHFGAHIWSRETGWEDWDLGIATKTWREAWNTLVARTDSHKPELAIVVFGNDQQNSDNRAGTTEAGTQQDNDSRYHKVFDTSLENSIWAIDSLLARGMKVRIVVVFGNHDPVSAWHLGKALEIWYRNNPNVEIDNSPAARKYFEWGVNMLMWTHGNKGRFKSYGQTMAAEQPQMWGRTRYRECHSADKHHRVAEEQAGATVRILPSLRPPCAWSSENHYVGSIRAAEAYAWNKGEGLVGTACYSILRESR